MLKFMEETLREVMGPDKFADSEALEFKLRIAREYGGSAIYIPKVDRDARRDAVLSEFNGKNRKEVCAKHNLSKAQFYRMLKGE